MRLEELEPRDACAADVGGGVLALDSGVRVAVYGDSWTGGLNVAATPDAIYVGPQGGGGPRLAALDPRTGSRLTNDVFVGDPGDRSGLIPLAVGGASPAPPEAPVTIGTGYTVFLDGATAAETRAAASYYAPVSDVVRFTNARPDLDPSAYLTVALGVPFGWEVARSPGAVGVSAVGTVGAPAATFAPRTGYVSDAVSGPLAGLVAAHEAGHALGLGHTAGGVMDPTPAFGATFDADQLATIRYSATHPGA